MTEQDPIELIRQAIAGELQTTVTEALQQTEQVEQGEPSAQSEAPQAPQPGPVMPTRSPSMPSMPTQKSSLVNSFESTPTGLNPTGGRSDGPLSTYKHGGEHKKTKEKVERNTSAGPDGVNLVQREDDYIKDKLDAGEWDPIGSTTQGAVNATKATGTLDNMKNWLINNVSPGPYPTGPQAISHVYKSIKDPQGLQYVDRPANRPVDPNAFQMPLNPNDPLYNQKANPELYNLPDNQNPDKVLRSDYRMYNQFLGTGYDNDLPESKFKPSKSDDPNAKYYSAAQYYGDPQTLLDRMVRSRGENDPEGSSYLPWEESELNNLKSEKGTWSRGMGVNSLPFSDDPGTTDTFHPMENWTMGAGEDDNGKYISIYDKYDFKSEKLNSLGEPFEIYDRIHYTTDKDGNRKYKEVKREGGLRRYNHGGPHDPPKKKYPSDTGPEYDPYEDLSFDSDNTSVNNYTLDALKEQKTNTGNPIYKDKFFQTAAEWSPVSGEILDAAHVVNDLSKGNYGNAALSAAGFMLPLVPGTAVKKLVKPLTDKVGDLKKKWSRYRNDIKIGDTMPEIEPDIYSDHANMDMIPTQRGKGMSTKEAIELRKKNIEISPGLKNSKPELYLHGTNSGSFAGIKQNDGLVPAGKMKTGLHSGEQGHFWGNHANTTGISTTRFDETRTPMRYSGAHGPQSVKSPLNDYNSFIDRKANFVSMHGDEVYESMRKSKENSLSHWNNATPFEKDMIENPYPAIFGINPKTRKHLDTRSMNSDIRFEQTINSPLKYDELTNMYVPKSKMEAASKYFDGKMHVRDLADIAKIDGRHGVDMYKWKKDGGLKYEDGGLKYDEGGPKKKLKKGTNVKQLQNFLIKKGYDLGAGEGKAITKGVGSFGPKTRAALSAYNKTQTFNTVRAIMPSPTDIIPTNVKEFFKSTVLPGWAYNMLGDLDEENLTKKQRSKLTQTVDEALKENKSQLGYKDNPNMKAYDEFGYSDMGNTSKFFDVVKKSLTSPAYNLKTTIGRANIIETPEYYDDEGNVIPSQRFVSDEYDFNDSKKAADRTFTEKWTDILGAGSVQAGMRAIGRNYGNTQPKNTMIRVQEEGGLRKKKK